MKLSTFATGAALSMLAVASANAADLRVAPQRAPAPAAVMQRIHTWTGFYAGVNAGYGWSNGSGTATIAGLGTGPFSGSGSGILGGVQAGYNWQAGNIVFGVETDIQASGGTGTFTGAGALAGVTGNTRNNYFGTIRGRVGYAVDTWLVYVTGGALYGDASITGAGVPTGPFSASTTYWSWTLGGGIEAMMTDRWSVKGEYLYVGTPNSAPLPPGTFNVTGSGDAHILRVGLNYHF